MRRPTALPPELTRESFAIIHGAAIGVKPGRLRTSDLRRPYRGVRSTDAELPEMAPDDPGWVAAAIERNRQRILDYAPRLEPGQFFSHTSAAILWGLPLPLPLVLEKRVHVSTYLPAQSPRAVGVIGHRLGKEAPLAMQGAVELTDPIGTLCLLAVRLPVADIVAIGDHLLFVHDPALDLDELVERTRQWRRRPGAATLRLAMPRVREGVRSPRETLLRLALVDAGFPEPLVNVHIYDSRGRFVGEGDLVYEQEKIVFEYEGDHHRTDRDQFQKDIQRRERFENAGYRVFRVVANDLGAGRADFLNRVHALFRARSRTSTSGAPPASEQFLRE